MPRSPLGLLNFLVLQWFFVRLAKVVDDQGNILRWTWLVGVWPLSGWGKPYKYLGAYCKTK